MNEHSSRLIGNNLVPCVLLTFDHKINISLLLLIVGFASAKSGQAMAYNQTDQFQHPCHIRG